LSITTKYETARFDVGGEANTVDQSGGWDALFEVADPAYNGSDNYSRSASEEHSNNNNESLTVTIDYDMGAYTLTSITGYSAYDYVDVQDIDFTPLQALTQNQKQEFDQWSQEIRLTSPLSDTFDFITGLYYQTSDLQHHRRLDSDIGTLAGAVPALVEVNGSPLPLNTANIADLLEVATFVAPPFSPTNKSAAILVTGLNGLAASRVGDYQQDAETWAVFGQGTWHVQENLYLTLGLRYTKESKEAQRTNYLSKYGTETALDPVADAGNIALQNAIFNAFDFGIQDGKTVENFSPSFKAQYDLSDDVMLYASVSKAFKSGGFGESGSIDKFEFDDEEALAFEVGGKLRVMDGRGSLNFALFHTGYEDLQVSAFVGDAFVVDNAAEATSQGVEVDGVFRVTEELTMTASMAYLDATYDEFSNASCSMAQVQASGGSARTCQQDLQGETLAYAPEWSANIGLNHIANIGDNLELHSNLNLNYVDEQYMAQDLDEQTLEESHLTVNARVALGNMDGNWELALVGKNLTDEEIRTFSNDIPLMDGAFFSYVAPPRTVAVQFSLAY